MRASNGVQLDVIGGNPSHPGEVRQESRNVVGEPEVDEHSSKCVEEESELGYLPSVGDRVKLGVERIVQGNCSQIAWPDSSRGIDKESPRETSETIPDKLERKRECD